MAVLQKVDSLVGLILEKEIFDCIIPVMLFRQSYRIAGDQGKKSDKC